MTHLHAVIKTIDHKDQRYDTVGDWKFDPPKMASGALRVAVSHMSDERYEFLIALHELIEAYLCKHVDISEEFVTEFDRGFESRRVALLKVLNVSLATTENAEAKGFIQRRIADLEELEPGDDPDAPYHEQHVFASKIERMVADELGVDWAAYSAEIESK